MMNNLIKNFQDYKEIFFLFLTSTDDEDNKYIQINRINVFNKIFKLHDQLFHYTLYKTFLNEDWVEIYSLYYVLSTFL